VYVTRRTAARIEAMVQKELAERRSADANVAGVAPCERGGSNATPLRSCSGQRVPTPTKTDFSDNAVSQDLAFSLSPNHGDSLT
jgi:hypothetical protein